MNDVICVMTSHPRSILVQLLELYSVSVVYACNGMYVCVCIDVSRVNGC